MKPAYKLEDFIKACGVVPRKVVILKKAKNDARNDFNLTTEEKLLRFISEGGLEIIHFIHSSEYRKNPDKNCTIMQDEYSFYSGNKFGYLAFFFALKTGNWIIKSFKLNRNPSTRNLPFSNLSALLNDNKSEE